MVFMLAMAGAGHGQVYRCGNSYSNEPCKGGRQVDVSPTLSDPRGAASKEIFLCRSQTHRFYWNHEHCSARGWMVERIERVPRSASWAQQVEMARARQEQAQAAAMPSHTPQARESSEAPGQVCQQLEERVKQLDSAGRAGSTHYNLDRIREERRQARDQQFRLRC